PAFVKELSVILRSENCQPFARQAAGLQLKNVLYAKEEETRAQYLNRWLALPADIRTHVKLLVVQTLGTEPFRPSIAAQCVAAIACAELPSGLWPDVIDALRTSVTNPGSTASLKESSLETLGYICQDIDAASLRASFVCFEVLEQQSNSILTAIVHGMRKEEPSFHVRLAATNALLNSLEFTKKNFGMEAERHIIMQVVCEATQCTDTHVKVAALQCLVRIMSLYYQFMEQYMGSALFAAAENNRVPEQVSRHYAKGAVSHICPLMLEILTHQDENDDDDDWTPSKAAGVCIMLMAQCVGDTILESVMPFLKHFSSTDWKYKVTIRDTAAWTIGRVLEICPEIVNKDGMLARLLPALSQGLHQEPRVAANVCWALVALVKTAYDIACGQGTDSTGQPDTYALSPCFEAMVSELIKTTDRTDGNQSNLRLAAFETLMELIKNSPKDCYPVVQSTTVLMLKKLEQLLNMEATTTSNSDKVPNCFISIIYVFENFHSTFVVEPAHGPAVTASPRLDKDVKVTILGCFGDIALAIGIHFERYIQIVMAMLAEASSAAIVTNPQDYDQVDYVDKLRENCVMAYTGILQGMRPVGSDTDPEKKNQAKISLSRFVPAMVKMIAICCETVPVSPSDGLVASVAGLIGDLVVLYGTQITPELSNDKVKALLDRGRKSRTSKTKSVAIWARKEMQKAMNAVTPAP
ncbi:Importin-beta protein, partial [Teladorsagia circumcincta]